MKKHVVNEARKALFGLYTNIRRLDLSIECQLKLFDNLLALILTYNYEVHTDFVERILKVKQSTPSVMLYSDLGRVPLSISIKKRVIGYWYDIINCDNKLSLILYRLILQDNVHTGTVTNG